MFDLTSDACYIRTWTWRCYCTQERTVGTLQHTSGEGENCKMTSCKYHTHLAADRARLKGDRESFSGFHVIPYLFQCSSH